MPSRSTCIPTYRHYKPKNLAVVRINGHDHYLGKFDSPGSHQLYHRLIAEWLASAGRSPASPQPGGTPTQRPLKISELILAYWRHAEVHYRNQDGESTQELENMRDAIRPLRHLYGSTDVATFGPLSLRSIQQEMVGSGLSRTTINARINRIRRVFKWGVGLELVPVAIYEALKAVAPLKRGRTVAPEPEGILPVSSGDVDAVLPHLPVPVAAMVRLQTLTGWRTEEVLAMRGCDLTPGESTWEYRPAQHKNSWRGQQRLIPLGPRAQAIIKEFLKEDPMAYLFSPRETVRAIHETRTRARKSRPTPSELARRCEAPGLGHGRRYSRRSYRQAIVRACRKAGVPEWTPLQLRHSAATMIRARYGVEAAQVVLGHAKADVTQLYAERDLAKATAIMAEIG